MIAEVLCLCLGQNLFRWFNHGLFLLLQSSIMNASSVMQWTDDKFLTKCATSLHTVRCNSIYCTLKHLMSSHPSKKCRETFPSMMYNIHRTCARQMYNVQCAFKFTLTCIACNLFCNVFNCMQAKSARQRQEKRLLSGSTCQKFPGPSSQSIAAKSLLHQHITSTTMCFKAHKGAELGAQSKHNQQLLAV